MMSIFSSAEVAVGTSGIIHMCSHLCSEDNKQHLKSLLKVSIENRKTPRHKNTSHQLNGLALELSPMSDMR
jgi:hypothetical protein